jgi:hypothetical protein
MSIAQAALTDEVLSRQERAVVRGVYRASQLNEALVALQKTVQNISDSNPKMGITSLSTKSSELMGYLVLQITRSLENIKVPATVLSVEDTSTKSE